MKISEAYASSYLKAADTGGRELDATIADCRLEDLGDETKPVLHFVGKDRGLVLNKTNATTLVDAYGDETDAWRGRRVVIYSSKTQFQGRMVDALRIRVPAESSPAPAAPPAPSDGFNDDIPW